MPDNETPSEQLASSNTSARSYNVTFIPFLGLGDVRSISDGAVTVWNADKTLEQIIPDVAVRDHVRKLLAMHCALTRDPSKPVPLRGIGIVTVGNVDFRVYDKADRERIMDFQVMLFLAALSHNAHLGVGPNVGHSIYTTENFMLVDQGFVPGQPWVSEQSGVIVVMTAGGYDINTTKWWRPSDVPSPRPFRSDGDMFAQLQWLRDNDSDLFRRILRAVRQFMEGYYNTSHVTISSRVYSQLVAFEILLDLPEEKQRKAFKERIAQLCDLPGDAKESYQFETSPGKSATESSTVKVIWADRFYSLRNHQIHGRTVPEAEYMFRGQHHLQAAPIVFVAIIKTLIERARANRDAGRGFSTPTTLEWRKWKNDETDPPSDAEGFQLVPDWGALLSGVVT